MKQRFLGYGRQTIDDADIAAVVDVLRGDFLTQGPAVERFETALADRVGAKHAIAVANGTAALHLACLAAGLKAGDVAVAPTMTFVATANAPLYCGARTELVDIGRHNLGLTADILRAALASHPETKAVLPVYFAGLADGAAELAAAADGRTIIADACHALGGVYEDGGPVGSCQHCDMSVFSFHPVKPITTAEGGAVTTNDSELARRLQILRNHGIERDPARFVDQADDEAGPWQHQQQALGFNYRMTDIQAALGLAQLDKLDAMLARRRQIAAYYDARLGNLENIVLPQSELAARARSGLHLYLLHIDFAALGITRPEAMTQLRDRGIGTQVHYIPVHRQPFHRDRIAGTPGDFPVSEQYYRGALSIPFFPSMTDHEVEFTVAAIKDLVQ
ncbi:MAG: UDP-4-amino-4,6-dideoxy-N-acetyl-beta-L-altrosamine transaminase [Alphaproteobacteria bacterium]|uniref:UDP-4-amino-4, 6-dideoxy-N-acetyl-beta-L-altrosamine transaminase n=2 Tax=Alphaproteobacteria TaxID=28211 RepID=UPI003266F547